MSLGVLADVAEKLRNILFATGNGVHQMMEFPCIRSIEAGERVQLRLFAFRQHIHSRIVGTQTCYCLLPELERNFTCHVASETVDSTLHPESHGISHTLPYILVFIIQIGCVRPVCSKGSVTFGITLIPVSCLACNPHGIR